MKTIKKTFFNYVFFLVCSFCITEQNTLFAKTSGKSPETPAWKESMREEFLKDLGHMQNIVIQGETPSQTAEFLCYFNDQVIWLDRMLALADSPTDKILGKLNRQKSVLKKIVRTQKETETILQDRIKNMTVISPRFAVLRLMILYEINSLIQQTNEEVSDHQQNMIVNKILEKASLEAGEPSYAPSAEEEAKDIQIPYSLFLETTQELAELKESNARNLDEISNLKNVVRNERRQRVGAELRSQLTEELADQRIREYSKRITASKSGEKK